MRLIIKIDNISDKSPPPAPKEEMPYLPNLLGPAGILPRSLIGSPPMMATGLTNPAFINQLQQIQRLHAQNSRLIGKLYNLINSLAIIYYRGSISKHVTKRCKIRSSTSTFSNCR